MGPDSSSWFHAQAGQSRWVWRFHLEELRLAFYDVQQWPGDPRVFNGAAVRHWGEMPAVHHRRFFHGTGQ